VIAVECIQEALSNFHRRQDDVHFAAQQNVHSVLRRILGYSDFDILKDFQKTTQQTSIDYMCICWRNSNTEQAICSGIIVILNIRYQGIIIDNHVANHTE
jgi:hypothetical protein